MLNTLPWSVDTDVNTFGPTTHRINCIMHTTLEFYMFKPSGNLVLLPLVKARISVGGFL